MFWMIRVIEVSPDVVKGMTGKFTMEHAICIFHRAHLGEPLLQIPVAQVPLN
jgi:hypothetical protein